MIFEHLVCPRQCRHTATPIDPNSNTRRTAVSLLYYPLSRRQPQNLPVGAPSNLGLGLTVEVGIQELIHGIRGSNPPEIRAKGQSKPAKLTRMMATDPNLEFGTTLPIQK